MLQRNIPPEITDAVDFNLQLKPCEIFTLDNGVKVYSINAGAQEVTMIELVFFAGNWYEDKNIVAATTNFLLKNGTGKKTAFAITSILNTMVHTSTVIVITKLPQLPCIVLTSTLIMSCLLLANW